MLFSDVVNMVVVVTEVIVVTVTRFEGLTEGVVDEVVLVDVVVSTTVDVATGTGVVVDLLVEDETPTVEVRETSDVATLVLSRVPLTKVPGVSGCEQTPY